MDFEENMVENELGEEMAEDSLPEGLTEESAVPEEESFEDILNEDGGEEQSASEEPEAKPQGTGGRKEPGYVKQRVAEAVEKTKAELTASLTASITASVKAEMEAQYAPLRERLLEMDALELVRKGVVKDVETAKELVRYRQGLPAQAAQPQEQTRDEKGRFAPAPKEDPVITARVDMLKHQADAIRADGGPDVIAAWKSDPDIKRKVISGEMDFYDVARQLSGKKKTAKKPPAPMRSPNGASGSTPNVLESLSDKQFERLEERIRGGARISSTR